MSALNLFISYLTHSSAITLLVLGWLSIYFIVSFSILISRTISLSSWKNSEKSSLDALLMGAKNVRNDSILKQCASGVHINFKLLNVCKRLAEKNVTIGLSWLAIISSTSPFIGLFGTVVSILETFGTLGGETSASLGVIAPAISEALIATASGILVAIPAYTFHAIIRRQGYQIVNLIERQIDVIDANMHKNESSDDRLE